jgi:hypothetical protein
MMPNKATETVRVILPKKPTRRTLKARKHEKKPLERQHLQKGQKKL